VIDEGVRAIDAAAPEGAVWICTACGKRASSLTDGGIDHGWDESCMMHAVLCDAASVELQGGRVVGAKAWR
jgi:hypothetical protein